MNHATRRPSYRHRQILWDSFNFFVVRYSVFYGNNRPAALPGDALPLWARPQQKDVDIFKAPKRKDILNP
jgi:hypothetical protein